MAGRAGRSGNAMFGVSILCCDFKDFKACRNIMQGFADSTYKTRSSMQKGLSPSFLRYILVRHVNEKYIYSSIVGINCLPF
jgi:hypothetical protein